MTTVLLVILAVAFLVAGASKLFHLQPIVDNFDRWHLPEGSRQVVGITELLIAALAVAGLWDDLEARLAAIIAILTMLAAIAIHLRSSDPPKDLAAPLVLLAIAVVVLTQVWA